jgi:hypothetical protein
LGAHADREGGDVLEGSREPHLPQDGLAADQPLVEPPGRAPGLVARLAEVRRLDGHLQAVPPATGIGWSEGSACTTGT